MSSPLRAASSSKVKLTPYDSAIRSIQAAEAVKCMGGVMALYACPQMKNKLYLVGTSLRSQVLGCLQPWTRSVGTMMKRRGMGLFKRRSIRVKTEGKQDSLCSCPLLCPEQSSGDIAMASSFDDTVFAIRSLCWCRVRHSGHSSKPTSVAYVRHRRHAESMSCATDWRDMLKTSSSAIVLTPSKAPLWSSTSCLHACQILSNRCITWSPDGRFSGLLAIHSSVKSLKSYM
mmetsp:Transcript_19138/g.34657  ORF Transcript_19138/g.34657 Transcript_19138/m.34657 type:complete len:230 (+) Transcript_19138:384-1073(+)